MTYEQVKTLKPTEFKRLCGVYPDTFKDMVTVLKAESNSGGCVRTGDRKTQKKNRNHTIVASRDTTH